MPPKARICCPYTTTKVVVLHNRLLARLLLLARCFILGILAFRISIEHSYASFTPATGVIQTWFTDNRMLVKCKSDDFTGLSVPPHCDNPTLYDVGCQCAYPNPIPPQLEKVCAAWQAVAGEFAVCDPKCVCTELAPHLVTDKGMARVSTADIIMPFTCDAQELNRTQGRSCHRHFGQRMTSILVGSEDVAMNFQYSLSNVEEPPPTRVFDHTGKLVLDSASYPFGVVGVSVHDWLTWAGVALEEEHKLPFPWPFELPLVRVTGARILLRLKFSNYRPYDFDTTLRCDIYVDHQTDSWGFAGTETIWDAGGVSGRDIHRMGMIFDTVFEGNIGKFDLSSLFMTIVSTIVLLSIAEQVVGALASVMKPTKDAYTRAKFQEIVAHQKVQMVQLEKQSAFGDAKVTVSPLLSSNRSDRSFKVANLSTTPNRRHTHSGRPPAKLKLSSGK